MNALTMNKTDVLVVGGGAAGMMAAITAAEQGASVRLVERMERLGRKINITGKGRCNVTNNAPAEVLMKHVAHNPRFLFSAFSCFDGQDTMAFFEALGVPLKTERGNRVFPVSDCAFDISAALRRRLQELRVEVVRDRITGLSREEGRLCGAVGEKKTYSADRVIVATGGVSYPGTGSSGDGYALARQAGHTVSEISGSLVPLVSSDTACREMQGLALKNVAIKLLDAGGKSRYEDFGEMLFTHFGLSGPIILSASAHMEGNASSYRLQIDLKPALEEEKLEQRLLRDFEAQPNKAFSNVVAGLVHKTMVPVILQRCRIPGELQVNSVTREQRRRLLWELKHFTIEITGVRPVEEAIVTRGGVSVKEINPHTMESKLQPGLYFAGEVLDVDAYTGGFNLQIAWATGHAAGESAGRKEQ